MAHNRRSFKLTHELLSTRVVMMEGNALRNYRAQLLHNFNSHIPVDELLDQLPPTDCHHMVTYKKGTHEVTGLQFFDENLNLVEAAMEGDEPVPARPADEDEERILVLEMTGPVTRYGGMCSYGSIDFRDLLIQYADDKSVVGFVLVTDTPGGTAFSLHDFAQGMEAWDAADKRSIQYIDGTSFSAGVALGSQCQKIIAQHGKDKVGCIGAMIAGWTTADGTIDSDGNRYIEVTANQTPDKNGEVRAAAAGDYKALQTEVNACCNDFIAVLDRCRPQIPAEQRTGHTYEAESVIGTLIDGIGTYEMACHYALTGEVLWNESPSATAQPTLDANPNATALVHPEDVVDDPDHNPDEDPDYDPVDDPDTTNTQHLTPNTQEDMTQLQAERLAAHTGLSAEEILAIANTEEQPAAPAEPEAQTEDPEAPATQTEEPAAPAAPAEPEAQTEDPEAPATQTEEPAAPAAPEDHQVEEDPTNTQHPTPNTQEAEVEQLTQQIAQYDRQVTDLLAQRDSLQEAHDTLQAERDQLAQRARESEEQNATAQADLHDAQDSLQQTQADLTSAQERITQLEGQLRDAQEEIRVLSTTATAAPQPAPAPQRQVHQTRTRITDDMTPEEKYAAYQERGRQLQKQR